MHTIKKRLRIFLPVLLFTAGILAGCKPPGHRALEAGAQLLDKGQYAAAIGELSKATDLMPTNAIAWHTLGLAYQYTGQYPLAENAYNHALKFDRNLAESRFNLGCVLLEQNKGEAARTQFTTYLMQRPPTAEVLVKMGMAQLNARDPLDAEKRFQEALRLSPQNAEAFNGLGLARMQRQRYLDAATYFQSARKADPSFAPALLNLAILKQQNLRDKAGALRDYREYAAMKPAPQDVEAAMRIIRALEAELAPPRVSAAPRQAQTNTPVAPPRTPVVSVNTNRAPAPTVVRSEPSASGTKQASPTPAPKSGVTSPVAPPALESVKVADEPPLRTAQDISLPNKEAVQSANPTNQESLALSTPGATPKPSKRTFLQSINPLNLFRPQENGATPTGQTNATSAAAPSTPSTSTGASESGLPVSSPRYKYSSFPKPAAGNRAEAERVFARGLQAQTGRRFQDAVDAYREATRLDPSFFEALYNLALTYSRQKKASTALATYERALAVRPDSADARYNFALLLMENGFAADAINEFEKVIADHPTEARAHLALGNLYAQDLRQPAKARVHYRRVIEIDPRHPQAKAITQWLKANP
jgi:tetratricopeptide (TPR) repeat protein